MLAVSIENGPFASKYHLRHERLDVVFEIGHPAVVAGLARHADRELKVIARKRDALALAFDLSLECLHAALGAGFENGLS